MYVKNRLFVLAQGKLNTLPFSKLRTPPINIFVFFRNRLKTDELNKHQNEKKNYRQWLLKISLVLAISQITQPSTSYKQFLFYLGID
jgi:hypothetical protein